MRVPIWFLAVLIGSLMAAFGWAITDRIDIGEELGSLRTVIPQLTRMERKIDRVEQLVQEHINASSRQRSTEETRGAGPAR